MSAGNGHFIQMIDICIKNDITIAMKIIISVVSIYINNTYNTNTWVLVEDLAEILLHYSMKYLAEMQYSFI